MNIQHYVIQLMDGKFLAADEIEAVSTDDLFKARRFKYLHTANMEALKHIDSTISRIKLHFVRTIVEINCRQIIKALAV